MAENRKNVLTQYTQWVYNIYNERRDAEDERKKKNARLHDCYGCKEIFEKFG